MLFHLSRFIFILTFQASFADNHSALIPNIISNAASIINSIFSTISPLSSTSTTSSSIPDESNSDHLLTNEPSYFPDSYTKTQQTSQLNTESNSIQTTSNSGYFKNAPNVVTKLSSSTSSSNSSDKTDACQYLSVTPYLPDNYTTAQQLAKVNIPQLNALNIASYSGYFTVDSAFDSNLFFWYFPAENSPQTAPVVLWLNGGPGASSLIGLFTENGPVSVDNNGNLIRRNCSWSKNNHMIYIDNPVGTGYSFTNSDEGYANNQTIIATYLLEALRQFFILFPSLQSNSFYLTGESYASKYITSLSHRILNYPIVPPINLQGMAIGNPVINPINQINYADYLYQHGIIDTNGQAQFETIQNEVINLIEQEAWLNATNLYLTLFTSPLPQYGLPLYTALTRLTDFHNYYKGSPGNPVIPEEPAHLTTFLTLNSTRYGIHVGSTNFHGVNNVTQVAQHLGIDLLMPDIENLCEALENFPVYIYNGQLDVQFAYPMMENVLQQLNCSGMAGYGTANRSIWNVDAGNVAGYVKKANNLTEIMIRDAGSLVPRDQPCWAFIMFDQMTSKQNFANLTFDGRVCTC